jgi:oligoendopeptidase F
MLYGKYRATGATFMEQYIELLSAGGSKSPADLLAPIGIDLARSDVWDAAFAELERLVALAEKSA